jgi:hypothetical protein
VITPVVPPVVVVPVLQGPSEVVVPPLAVVPFAPVFLGPQAVLVVVAPPTQPLALVVVENEVPVPVPVVVPEAPAPAPYVPPVRPPKPYRN